MQHSLHSGEAEMHVVNNGCSSGIRNFGHYSDAASLAYAGSIIQRAKNGSAKFEPRARCTTPAPAFVGDD